MRNRIMCTSNTAICTGCGAKLQTISAEKIGYIPEKKLDMNSAELLCMRCFRLRKYSDGTSAAISNDESLEILHDLINVKALIVYVVDIFDPFGSEITSLHRFVGNNKVLLVGNKKDLIPKSVKEDKIITWLKSQVGKQNLRPVDFCLINSKTGHGIEEVVSKIDRISKNEKIYIVGCTNVGKSSFLNKLINFYSNESSNQLTVSCFPGTTSGIVKIPLNRHVNVYDTPGITNPHSLHSYISVLNLRLTMPAKELKVRTYQLKAEQTLFFAGFVRLDFVQGKPSSFSCYISNQLSIHRTKLINADCMYRKHIGTLLSPPDVKEANTLPPLIPHYFTLPKGKVDIVFAGLGWVAINGAGGNVTAHVPKGVDVALRDCLI